MSSCQCRNRNPDAPDSRAILQAYERLGQHLYVAQVGQLAGIPAADQLIAEIATLTGLSPVALAQVAQSEAVPETGFWTAVLEGGAALGRLLWGGLRTGVTAAASFAARNPTLTLGALGILGWTAASVLPEMRRADQMARTIRDELDRMTPAERARVVGEWGQTYAGASSGLSTGTILALGGGVLALILLSRVL